MPQNKKGFTLLELLIVIGIIAILSVAIIFVLNPAETLRKSRDSQRLADLGTLKTALGLYLTSTSTPWLGGASSNTTCKTGSGAGTYASGDKLYYSIPSDTSDITDTTLDAETTNLTDNQIALVNVGLTDGTGWLPVNLDSMTGGSPISNMPLDPVNALVAPDLVTSVGSSTLAYRYVCNATTLTFELDAVLESTSFTVDDDKRKKDGGNDASYYEVGTNLKLLGAGTDDF
ncbi:MAG: type II secretion system protein [Patescibacteria group bacterium]